MAIVPTRLRSRVGAVTSDGVLHVFAPMDVPEVDGTVVDVHQGVPLVQFLGLERGDNEIVGLCGLDADPVLGVATRLGVIKRVALTSLADRPQHTIIGLKSGDRVVSAWLSRDTENVVLISDQASLLHFPATAVRPQGLPAGGMAGISLPEGASVLFGAGVDPGEAWVVTVSGSSTVLPGTAAQRVKRTPLSEFPPKGRATGGVRAHAFLKGEDTLLQAWVGPRPLAVDARGASVALPENQAKRDASGSPCEGEISALGSDAGPGEA